jgi:rhomboid protease GluP
MRMESHKRQSILCPNCRKLVSIDEPTCPHCGLHSPGASWRNTFLFRSLLDDRQLIRIMIYVNAAMFILSLVVNPTATGFSMNPLAFLSPDNRSLLLLGATGTIPIGQLHRWWTVLSANYLHASILHLLFNMMAFYQIAPLILQEYGTYRMLALYTLSGVGGYLVSYLAGIPFTLGASAAVCGLIGAALYYGRSRGGYYGQMVYQQVGGWALGIFFFGFLFPGINNWAHGGGLLCGVVAGAALGYRERLPETFVHKGVATICIVATLAALIWAVFTTLAMIFFMPVS